MPKARATIPKAIRDQVLEEYNHRCAICGGDKPHLHHIDGDPAHNDPMNLIPLCPNHHLIDQHDPVKPIDPKKLGLFREYKDPTILKPQFHPLFVRLQWLDTIEDDSDTGELERKAGELRRFVEVHKMGGFYSTQIEILLRRPQNLFALTPAPGYENQHRLGKEKSDQNYRAQLRKARDQVYSLVMELLRYQNW